MVFLNGARVLRALGGGQWAGLVLALGLGASVVAEPVEVDTPLRGLEAGGGSVGTPLVIDHAVVEQLARVGSARIAAFPLEDGVSVDLDLHRIRVLSGDARVVVGTDAGDRAIARPDVLLLGGSVVSSTGSTVFLSFFRDGVNGYVEVDGHTHVISSGPSDRPRQPIVYDLTTLPAGVIDFEPFVCHTPAPADIPWSGRSAGRSVAPCRVAQVGIDSDWEFTNRLFGGDVDASAAYALTLVGAISQIYQRDLNIRMEITFLRVWDTSDDPWTQTDIGRQLTQFRNYWQIFMYDVPRNDAHLLSGRNLGGGVGELPGLCQGVHGGYALSANLGGFFPYPAVDFDRQNWDPYVVGHEFGHNFGAPHTHEMTPPVDTCASGGCIHDGTIMSYCHLCPGGLRNIRLGFHERNVNENILPFLDSLSCDLLAPPVTITSQPQSVSTCPGLPVTFAVAAEGEGTLTYQWRFNGGIIPGATGTTYTISSASAFFEGDYDVLVTNGSCEAISDPASLSVGAFCTADLTGDCTVDVGDFFAFVAAFSVSDPAADLNGDGSVDVRDFFAFLIAFQGGCG